jgi:CheY-like chemotaxis protein
VGEVEDGDTAVALARQHQPDLVLMDVMMPGIDGFEATRQIKQALPATKVGGPDQLARRLHAPRGIRERGRLVRGQARDRDEIAARDLECSSAEK